MENALEMIHRLVLMGVTTLFLFQSVILFIRSKDNRVRKTMAILELLLGLGYAVVLWFITVINTPNEFSLFREEVLVTGSFYIAFMIFFPMQVFIPGWLTWKRGFLLIFPIILMAIMYYGGTYLLGESPENLRSYADLCKSFGHFNVWFRFVILFFDFVYMGLLLRWLYTYEKRYIQWKNDNYADQEYLDVSWMRQFAYILLGISVFYLLNLFFGGEVIVISHCSFAVLCFSYLFYKTLFYESPYPKDFFAKESLRPVFSSSEKKETAEIETVTDSSFETRIPTYVEKCKQWMDEEKPFLYTDFKLMDVTRIIPLNRSYLSRLFNEGFGKSFSEVVREYRVNYSKELLKKDLLLSIHEVASMSGFHSDSTFIRAFKQVEGTTPTQFRALIDRKDVADTDMSI